MMNQFASTMYGTNKRMVKGTRTIADVRIIRRGYRILRTCLSGPVFTYAVLSNTFIHKVTTTSAFASARARAIEKGADQENIEMETALSVKPELIAL